LVNSSRSYASKQMAFFKLKLFYDTFYEISPSRDKHISK